MINKEEIKELVLGCGADLFGVASRDRFDVAPEGFHPCDIYSQTRSVIVFAIRVPSESLFADNPVPYTHTNTLAMQKVDLMTFEISVELEKAGVRTVVIPTDDPYLHWEETAQQGKGILSLRHAGYLAGLGKLGRNNLLINKEYGNMIQIGALLTDLELEPDPIAEYEVCPTHCRICLDNCPAQALTGETVIQEYCRPLSNYETTKGFVLKKCFECRRKCPRTFGINKFFMMS